MKLLLDTADLKAIKKAASTGLVDGVTTNPTHLKNAGIDSTNLARHIKRIGEMVSGPISVETIETKAQAIVEDAREIALFNANVVVKVPMTADGLKAVQKLASEHGIRCNVTCVFQPGQALLAGKAGAYFISPFIDRHSRIGQDGHLMLRECIDLVHHYGFGYNSHKTASDPLTQQWDTEVLAASVKNCGQVIDAASAGADACTMPPDVFWQLFSHPLTDQAIATFAEDAEQAECMDQFALPEDKSNTHT